MITEVSLDNAAIRRLRPIGSLDDGGLLQVKDTARSYSLPLGAVLSGRTVTGYFVYLLSGTAVELNAKGERVGLIEPGTAAAEEPLFSGDMSEGGVEAKTKIEYLQVDRLLFEMLMGRQNSAGTEVEGFDFDEDDAEIFSSIYDAFSSKKLKVPSLPEVLIEVNKAIDDPDMGFAEIAQIIQQDPPYTARLIQLANSAAFKGNEPVNTLSMAISRIGVKSVRSLLMGVAVEKMIGNVSPLAVDLLRDFYRQAGDIAALSFVLARRVGSVAEERALMAGLLHRLGKVPVISHAFDVLDPAPERARVERAADRLVESVTAWMLGEWGLDGELCDVAEGSSDWYRDCGGGLGLLEVVLAAQLLHQHRENGSMEVCLSETPTGRALVELGVDIGDPDKFFVEISEELEAARELV